MTTAPAVIESVEVKEGVSQKTQKPWKKYIVHTKGGVNYSTFDAQLGTLAYQLVGKPVTVAYEEGQYGRDLKGLAEDPSGVVPQEPAVRDQTPNGDPDWDLIGLRKTRCHLWGAWLQNPLAKEMGAQAAAAFGRELVLAAETDIYHRAPAHDTDDIPF
jgi:hypothetical protein